MSLQESDFRSERRSLDEKFRWVLRHAAGGYGLVPSRPGAPDPLLLEHEVADGRLTLHLNRCLAIASDGSLIHVDTTAAEETEKSPEVTASVHLGEAPQGNLHVFVEARRGGFQEYGPLSEGEPSRHAWCYPAYALQVLGEVPPGAPGRLEIARFRVEGGEAMRVDFIPPCMAVGAHRALREKQEEMKGHLQSCRNASIHSIQARAQERLEKKSEAAAGASPSERFFQALAAAATDCYSEIVDAGPDQSPRGLVAVGRRFLRMTRTLVEAHPEVRQHSWENHLRSSGRGIADHVAFVRELESRMGSEVPVHPIADVLNPVLKLVALVAAFPGGSVDDREIAPDRTEQTDVLVYQGKTYYPVRYTELKLRAGQDSNYLDIAGLSPKAGGRFLVWIRCEDRGQRSLAQTLRCGGPEQSSFMWMRPQTPDLEYDDRVVLLTLKVEGDKPIDRIHLASRKGDMDLGRLSTVNDEDVRIFHRP